MVEAETLERVTARVKELAAGYEPPEFAEVPTPDAALFLTAIDHGTGFRDSHEVDGAGPYEGSSLLWALGLRAERRAPGALTARSLLGVDPAAIAAVFRIGGESLADPERRAQLWDDLARGLIENYQGEASALIAATGGRLGGDGALKLLGGFEAFSDPLQKKSFLVCKIWERRGWLTVADPEHWEVSADNVLADGTSRKISYTANYDGKDAPVMGTPDYDMVAMTRNGSTVTGTRKKGGKQVQTFTTVVSADGKTRTTTATGTNAAGQKVDNAQVYDKQ